MSPTGPRQKQLGAFYTDLDVIDAMIAWATTTPRAAAFDPSCGDGRFLHAASRAGIARVVGADLDPNAITTTRDNLSALRVTPELHRGDFFALDPSAVKPVDLVIGNPPFVRYHRFTGASRRRALESALALGVQLTQLTSSWAPFVLHAMRFLAAGGAMAFVVPSEIVQTQYGAPVLRAVAAHFAEVTLVSFERNLFAEVQTETMLLLATGHRQGPGEVRLLPLRDRSELGRVTARGVREESRAFGGARLASMFVTLDEQKVLDRILVRPEVHALHTLGAMTNGYVTGDNAFFHACADDAQARGMPSSWLRPTTRAARSLRGLSYTAADIAALERDGQAHHLILPSDDLFARAPEALNAWVTEGERAGVHTKYKCRARNPWWKVPGAQSAHVLFTYMAGENPRAAFNEANATYCNTLHGIRLNEPVNARLVAAAFHTSLTMLSLEIEGRSYGGGILKVEPTEMQKVVVALPAISPGRLDALVNTMDAALRAGRPDDAVAAADDEILIRSMKLKRATVEHLRTARTRLVQRRTQRAKRET